MTISRKGAAPHPFNKATEEGSSCFASESAKGKCRFFDTKSVYSTVDEGYY